MKCILGIYVALTILDKTKCLVTNSTKTTEDDTGMPMQNSTRILDEDKEENLKQEMKKTLKAERNHVYLDDVLFALKNQNWTAEEKSCLNETLRLLRSLQNFTLWAVWDWDSISSEPQGLLFGNRHQLGNFDECMNPPWFDDHPELRTQYCLAEIVLERTEKVPKRTLRKPFSPYHSALDYVQFRPLYSRPLNELTWGVCVPSSCKPRSVKRLLGVMLARSHLGTAGLRPQISITEKCQRADEPREFDESFYVFISVIALLAAIAVVCTFLNSKKKANAPRSDIIKCFCMVENAKNLLKMKKEGTEVLYGIRFLTICFIVMDHQIGFFNSGPISNGLHVDRDTMSTIGMFILHDDLFVDTFFLLSGLLTATMLTNFKKLPNPLILIVKRYIRLVIAFAVVVFFYCAIFPYIGTGPLWPRVVTGETDPCRKNWWLNLLMLNNYIDTENICIVVSWYIPCDFHFFTITVLLYWTYKRCPRLAVSCAGIITVASVFAPGIINYVNGLHAVQLFTYDFIIDPRGSEQFNLTYIKSHTRFAAYIVGFFTGYLFTFCRTTENKRISQKWSVLGTCTGLTIMLVVMVVGTTFLWRSYHPLEGAIYAALDRPVWACGVALIVLCCSLGHVPLVKSFLSWYPWVPLSRLAYGLYLTHTALIARNVFVTRNPQHNDYINLLNSSAGVIFWGCVAAFIIWLLAEAPANNLLTICLKSKAKPVVNEDVANETNTNGSGATENRGYRDNLPTVIQISSKM